MPRARNTSASPSFWQQMPTAAGGDLAARDLHALVALGMRADADVVARCRLAHALEVGFEAVEIEDQRRVSTSCSRSPGAAGIQLERMGAKSNRLRADAREPALRSVQCAPRECGQRHGRTMSIKSDRWIRRMAAQGMIEPFEPGQVRERDGVRIVSYGTSSYGYDIRVRRFKIFTNINSTIVDPKAFDPNSFVDLKNDVCIIRPIRSRSRAPSSTFASAQRAHDLPGKKQYARCGIIVNVTPLEPEWEGHVTLEFSNTTPLPQDLCR